MSYEGIQVVFRYLYNLHSLVGVMYRTNSLFYIALFLLGSACLVRLAYIIMTDILS